MDIPSAIVAAVRVRPFFSRELTTHDELPIVEMPKPGVVWLRSKRLPTAPQHQFTFDHTFWSCTKGTGGSNHNLPYADQEDVYKALAYPLLMRAIQGYNACLFAYGMTSSGKTYSISGPPENPGIIPRLVADLFTHITREQSAECSYSVEMSYFEIYNERIRDLLSSDKVTAGATGLSIREHPVTGPYVEGLCRLGVRSATDVMGWLRVGNRQRTVASTLWNEESSRSHAVFTLFLTRCSMAKHPFGDIIENVYNSQINVVDLAGSERQASGKPVAERLNESGQINKSLFTLGKVISQLASGSQTHDANSVPASEPRFPRIAKDSIKWSTPNRSTTRKGGYVSYRDSVLTWLLRESLGGNAMTAMLATISPSTLHWNETLTTLRYATKAQSIVNKAMINEEPQGRLIRELMAEVKRLRQESSVRCEPGSPQVFEVARLREILAIRESEIRQLSRQLAESSLGPCRSPSILRSSSCVTASTIRPSSTPYRPKVDMVDQITSPIMCMEPCSFTTSSCYTPMRAQHVNPQPIVCGTEQTHGTDRSITAVVSTQDVAVPIQSTFLCDPQELECLRKEVTRLREDKIEALRSLGQSELRVQELELNVYALKTDALYSTRLADTYQQAYNSLYTRHEQSFRVIQVLLETLLQRTEELRFLVNSFMQSEPSSPISSAKSMSQDDPSETFNKENIPPVNDTVIDAKHPHVSPSPILVTPPVETMDYTQ